MADSPEKVPLSHSRTLVEYVPYTALVAGVLYFGFDAENYETFQDWFNSHVDLEAIFGQIKLPNLGDAYEATENVSFLVAFEKLGIGSIWLPDEVQDSIVQAGGFIDYGDARGPIAYTVVQNDQGLVTITETKSGTNTGSYYEWRKPAQPPAPTAVEVTPAPPEVKPEQVTPVQEVEKPIEHHPKPKIDYDLAERNLSGVAQRYETGETSDELVRGMQDGALRYKDEPVTLTQEEALSALQNGTFVKDGVRWEVWESKTYPGTFYITKLPV